MRLFCFVILVLVAGAVAIFAMQNNETVTVHYLDRSTTSSLPMLVAVVYLLGMVTGWTVVGFLKRSLRQVTARRED